MDKHSDVRPIQHFIMDLWKVRGWSRSFWSFLCCHTAFDLQVQQRPEGSAGDSNGMELF